jgi:hypothetical protein
MSEAMFGACSFYRSMGVLPKLSKLDPQITVEPLDMRDWHDIVDTDIVFFERPSQSHVYTGMEQIKDFGLKVWLDFDDDLFNVPVKPFNPSGNHFNDLRDRRSSDQVVADGGHCYGVH